MRKMVMLANITICNPTKWHSWNHNAQFVIIWTMCVQEIFLETFPLTIKISWNHNLRVLDKLYHVFSRIFSSLEKNAIDQLLFYEKMMDLK